MSELAAELGYAKMLLNSIKVRKDNSLIKHAANTFSLLFRSLFNLFFAALVSIQDHHSHVDPGSFGGNLLYLGKLPPPGDQKRALLLLF